jgi:hypothetical protein
MHLGQCGQVSVHQQLDPNSGQWLLKKLSRLTLIKKFPICANQYFPCNRIYQNDKHQAYGWDQDKFPCYPKLTKKPTSSGSELSGGSQHIVNVDNDVRPAVQPEPTSSVERTAKALVQHRKVDNTMKGQLKMILCIARPHDDRMFAAEHDTFDYQSKINPHTMPLPMIQATMSAARGSTECDYFNLRTNLCGVDKKQF